MSDFSITKPWIREREATFCGWKPETPRGFCQNFDVSLIPDFYSFSDQQLQSYVKMIKSFGFTGMQVTDGCTMWRGSGSYHHAHDIFRKVACYLHEEGMQFTLWVWASNFNGHGWNDKDVCYIPAEGYTAYTDPKVFACFNKYYDIYAELADVTDRLIAHFFDPGNLGDYNDVFAYTRLLESKFRLKNPGIKMAVDTWGCPDDYPSRLVEAGFSEYMLMELPYLPGWRGGRRADFRKKVLETGCELGSWGWYTLELECDQNASFFVNERVLKDVYNRTRSDADDIMVPVYWSEMESYHIINIFSLYCAGQLLINPERDTDELLYEIAYGIYGEKYGAAVLSMLHLVSDARSGDSWNTYWWTEPGYNVGGDNPEDILKRTEESIKEITAISEDKKNVSRFPLSVEPYLILKLILPHLEQIRRYAKFRIDMRVLETSLANGAEKQKLYSELDRIWHPIPQFNTLTGVWGGYEQWLQQRMVLDFCERAGIYVPYKAMRFYLGKKRMFEMMTTMQRGLSEPVTVTPRFYEGYLAYSKAEYDAIFTSLEQDGLITRRGDNAYILTDWDNWKFDINI